MAAANQSPAAAPGHACTRAYGYGPGGRDCGDRTRVKVNIANNAELRANTKNIHTLIRSSRPKNTHLQYKPKQEEFKSFCAQKEYCDGDTVTEEKLLLFLVEQVAN